MGPTSLLFLLLVALGCAEQPSDHTFPVVKTEAEWKAELSAEQYRILREKGTERAFTGKYWDSHADGTFVCAACGHVLFDSKTKFDSGTGWPSYYEPAHTASVALEVDRTFGMARTEVLCANCGGHLGHVFDDGPRPTGKRYCINGNALDFQSREAPAAPSEGTAP